MRPHRFVVLDALPRTAGGKIDYQALPAAGVLREAEGRVAARDATESELARIWEEILDVRPIGVTDNFFALGGDSLLAVRLVSAVHHRLGRELPLAVLLQEGTVASMAEAVRRDDAAAFASPLVGFRTSGSRPPIFLPHALDGSVLCYAELARHLGPEQPVYGLQHPGLYDGAEPHGIEALASRYIEALLPVQPRGPYLLGGWSLGGVIAFEIARQLEARGEPVALLALLDAWVSPAGFRTLPQDEVGPLLDHLLPDARGPGLDDVRPGRTRQVIRNNVGALQRYAPGPYAGRIVLLRTAGVSPRGDATLGWGALAGSGVRVRALPGDHDTMLRPPHVRVLAEELNAAIERATRRPASPSPSDQAVVLQVVHVDALVEQDRLGEE
jgi:thioesterase domain-containing protein/acyl carrier protein